MDPKIQPLFRDFREQAVHARFTELIKKVCEAYHCTADVEIECGNTLLSNDAEMADAVRAVAAEVVGKENIQSDNVATMLGDDFAEFSRRVPGVYYFLGTRNPAKGTELP